ncbi:hypothetical protein [Priestia endophytica]|uniref:hypothetical protein n=1 Tax=Priestia endophytica TaxID=135735 RepID=UPI00227DEBF3|nr:hypothetical protein [Priestia endophytica]MCY8232252.1 hypothetical protein [Priestia endophytica]
MHNIHDNQILNYQVDFQQSKIEIHIVNEQGKRAKILFQDLFAYHFEDELPNSTLLDIVDEMIDSFLVENKGLLAVRKGYSWPMDYEDIAELII